MKNNFGYKPQSERKKILLLCDDIRMHSGIGNMGREIVLKTAQHFNWFNLGAGINHPEVGKLIDLSDETNKLTGLEDSSIRVLPFNGYGNPDIIRQILNQEKPDAIMIFTDPRYWVWLFQIEREIRSSIPIIYLNIWDDLPAPLYNRAYYQSVDTLLAISKQTKLINEVVLGEEAKEKIIEYVPHGIDETQFFPLDNSSQEYEEFEKVKKQIFDGKDIKFCILYNSRNIRRKSTSDLILAYSRFCELIGKEEAKKCALILHTEPVLNEGTDLVAVKDAFCDPEYVNVFFSANKLTTKQLNYLYNLADATVLPSSNEGWGLSLTESMMTGTMIIANVTGGMQDQMRFVDKKGKWYTPSKDIPSNHRGTFRECGEWAVPLFPTSPNLQGSPPTPYIFDDKCSPEAIAEGILTVWNLTPEERKKRGLAGREWATSEEAGFTATTMGNRIIEHIDRTLESFTPRSQYDIFKIEDSKPDLIPHKLFDY